MKEQKQVIINPTTIIAKIKDKEIRKQLMEDLLNFKRQISIIHKFISEDRGGYLGNALLA